MHVGKSIIKQELGCSDEKLINNVETAWEMLYKMCFMKDAGFLTMPLIKEVHGIIMKDVYENAGEFSEHERFCEYNGEMHLYSRRSTDEWEAIIETLCDQWNESFLVLSQEDNECVKKMVKLIAWFIGKFLDYHPFGDGNGRTARVLACYLCYSKAGALCLIKGDLAEAMILWRKGSECGLIDKVMEGIIWE